jgi:glutamine cyclotransferase
MVDGRLPKERRRGSPQAVLNGIAARAGAGEFLLTGKTWRCLHHVRLVAGLRRKPTGQLLAAGR